MITIDFTGRLTADATIKSTTNGEQVLKFSVACNRFKQSTKFFECNFWGKRGASLAKLLGKGKWVHVTGEPREREYNGKIYENIEVFNVEPVFNMSSEETPSTLNTDTQPEPKSEFGTNITADDMRHYNSVDIKYGNRPQFTENDIKNAEEKEKAAKESMKDEFGAVFEDVFSEKDTDIPF